jgi:ankyrin repeat protein
MNGERAPADMAELARPRAAELRGAFNDAARLGSPERAPRYNLDDLFDAVRKEDARRVQLIISSGVDVNGKNDDGDTPLVVAAKEGKTRVIATLMQNKANPLLGDRVNRNPMRLVVEKGHLETLVEMLKHDISPNAATPEGVRPLEVAISRMGMITRGREIFDALMGANADVTQVPGDNTTLVMIAAASDNDYALKALIAKKASIGGVSTHGHSALTVAARNNSAKAVKILLDAGADVTHVTQEGLTASQEAAKAGFPELAKVLHDAENKYVETVIKSGTGHETTAPKTAKFKKPGDGQKPK